MNSEELKALLLSGEEEGADRASIYDKVVEAFNETATKAADAISKVDELTNRVGQLTDTNFKLLEKIRYTDQPGGDPIADPEPETMTLEKLFEEG